MFPNNYTTREFLWNSWSQDPHRSPGFVKNMPFDALHGLIKDWNDAMDMVRALHGDAGDRGDGEDDSMDIDLE